MGYPAVLQNIKHDYFIAPQAIVDNDDPVGARGDANPRSVDTTGYEFATVRVFVGATDIAASALALYHGDSAASGADDSDFTQITDGAFSGSTGTTRLPQADDDNNFFVWHLDLRDKKTHLLIELLGGNGSAGAFFYADIIMYGGGESLDSATDRNVAGEIFLT